jgi:hypothetical protein
MIAHLQEGRTGDLQILKPETARAMHARVFSPHPAVGGSGLGFYETYVNGRRIIGHGGDTNYFHSELGLLENEAIGYFVSVNTGGKAALVPRHFVRAFMNHYFPARLPLVTPPDDFAARAEKYAGRYGALRHSYTRFEKVFGLFGGSAVAPTGKNTLVIPDLFGHSAQYAEVAPSVFREVGGDRTVAFVENGAGQVVGMVGQFAFIPFYKLRWCESSPFHLRCSGSPLFFVIAWCRHCGTGRATRRGRERALGAPQPRRAGSPQPGLRRGLRASFAAGRDDIIFSLPKGIYAVLTLPLIGLALTALAAVLAVRAWRESYWTRGSRLLHGAGVVAAIAFMWFLNYWNLLGYRIG